MIADGYENGGGLPASPEEDPATRTGQPPAPALAGGRLAVSAEASQVAPEANELILAFGEEAGIYTREHVDAILYNGFAGPDDEEAFFACRYTFTNDDRVKVLRNPDDCQQNLYVVFPNGPEAEDAKALKALLQHSREIFKKLDKTWTRGPFALEDYVAFCDQKLARSPALQELVATDPHYYLHFFRLLAAQHAGITYRERIVSPATIVPPVASPAAEGEVASGGPDAVEIATRSGSHEPAGVMEKQRVTEKQNKAPLQRVFERVRLINRPTILSLQAVLDLAFGERMGSGRQVESFVADFVGHRNVKLTSHKNVYLVGPRPPSNALMAAVRHMSERLDASLASLAAKADTDIVPVVPEDVFEAFDQMIQAQSGEVLTYDRQLLADLLKAHPRIAHTISILPMNRVSPLGSLELAEEAKTMLRACVREFHRTKTKEGPCIVTFGEIQNHVLAQTGLAMFPEEALKLALETYRDFRLIKNEAGDTRLPFCILLSTEDVFVQLNGHLINVVGQARMLSGELVTELRLSNTPSVTVDQMLNKVRTRGLGRHSEVVEQLFLAFLETHPAVTRTRTDPEGYIIKRHGADPRG